MKDTVLTARRKKIEIITLLVCFVLANLVNLYAIITYHRSMMEMITSIFYIIIFAFVLYAAWALLWSESAIHKEEKQAVRTDLNEYT